MTGAGRRQRGSGLSLYLARRYLKSARRDAFVTFLSLTAAGGMALGVAALVLSLAMLTGLQRALKGEILARTPEIEVELPPDADREAARARLEALPAVRGAQFALRGRGWVLARGRARPVRLVGFEGGLPATFPGPDGGREGLYLSDRLAAAWGLEPGEVVEVASSRPTLSPLGPLPRVRRLPLAGVFESSRAQEEERVALPLGEARALLGDAELRLLLVTGDLGRAERLAPAARAVLPAGSAVRTWRELNRGLFFALRLEKSLLFTAVLLIAVVAGLALVADLSLIIANKRPELGMLGAMGASPRALRRVFLWFGGLLAALGGGVGLAVGVAAAWVMDRFQLLRLGDAFFMAHVPFRVEVADLAVILTAVAIVTLVCAGWAARRAAALSPVEALRR